MSYGLSVLLAALGLGASRAAELKPGDEAPAFSLVGSDGKTYSSADLKGKAYVIAWFPKAMTPGCTAVCKSLKANGDALRQFDVAYFAASCDSPAANKQFAEKVAADFPILSDPEAQLALPMGVVGSGPKFAKRWTFYVGPDGRVLHVDKDVRTASHGADVAAKLKELGVKAAP
jgi:peroxiredoxin Q/BCP